MTPRRLAHVLAVGALLVGAACGSPSAAGPGGGRSPSTSSATTAPVSPSTAPDAIPDPAPSASSPPRAVDPGPAVLLRPFVGTWVGHTRFLRVGRDGRAVETVDDGCCHHVITVRYRLLQAHSVPGGTVAVAVVVLARPGDEWSGTLPRPGQQLTMRLRRGILTSPVGQTYCGPGAPAGACGA